MELNQITIDVSSLDAPPTDQTWRWREAWLTDPDGRRVCIFHAGPDRRFPPWRFAPDKETQE